MPAGSTLLGARHKSCGGARASPGDSTCTLPKQTCDCAAHHPFYLLSCKGVCECCPSPQDNISRRHTSLQELDVLLEEAAKAGVQPVIGMRAKLATRHGGHWGTTSGENAKFGISPSDMVAVMKNLMAAGMADCLQLLHFHIGSQVCI